MRRYVEKWAGFVLDLEPLPEDRSKRAAYVADVLERLARDLRESASTLEAHNMMVVASPVWTKDGKYAGGFKIVNRRER